MRATLVLLVFVAAAAALARVEAKTWEEDDMIIVEAADDDDDEGSSNRRSARQFVTESNDDGAATILRPFGGLSRVASMEQPCETNDGRSGRCATVNKCYPYFKLFQFDVSEQWVMGTYDTCKFSGPTRSYVFGICCPDPDSKPTKSPIPTLELNSTASVDKEDEDYPLEESKLPFHCGNRESIFIGGDDVPNKQPFVPSIVGVGSGVQDGSLGIVGGDANNDNHQIVPGLGSVPVPGGIINRYPWPLRVPFTPVAYLGVANSPLPPPPPPSPYIVNGWGARNHQFPFMAAILNGNRQFCGGALITEVHILTAAHCVAHMSKYDVRNLRVILGLSDLTDAPDGIPELFNDPPFLRSGGHDKFARNLRVRRVIRHKDFDVSKLYNDIAILTLEKPLYDNAKGAIQPICIEKHRDRTYKGDDAIVAGWGTLRDGGATSNSLRFVDVRVWGNPACQLSYGLRAPGGIVSTMLCANKPEQNKDSCSGDSGGPLFVCDPKCRQIGITSWGIGCARDRFPGVYTRVAAYQDWIEKIVHKY